VTARLIVDDLFEFSDGTIVLVGPFTGEGRVTAAPAEVRVGDTVLAAAHVIGERRPGPATPAGVRIVQIRSLPAEQRAELRSALRGTDPVTLVLETV
jgi:hypothetical protein